MLWLLFILQAWRLWYVAVSNELHEKVWVQTPEPLAQRQHTRLEGTVSSALLRGKDFSTSAFFVLPNISSFLNLTLGLQLRHNVLVKIRDEIPVCGWMLAFW